MDPRFPWPHDEVRHECCSGLISRRDALKLTLFGTAGCLALSERLLLSALGQAEKPARAARAKAVIQIWLQGGPSHLDTFDPKPGAGADYCGPLRTPLSTNVDGIQISELFPNLGKMADKYSIIRSMTHGNNGHETAAYMVQTGRPSGGRDVFPCAGAVVSLLKGSNPDQPSLLPPYIVLTQPQGRFSESGFMGSRYKPFATGGDPKQTPFAVEGIIGKGITPERQKARRDFLKQLDTLGRNAPGAKILSAASEVERQAYEMILGDAGKVFDLSMESNETRDRYGRSTFGQSCLAARRLVEKGVPYVTINYGGWDSHKENFQAMRQRCPELDKGVSALLQDLSDRGLLDQTVVWCCGEFGRTPKVQFEAPWNGGRGHHGKVFSALVAGGGFKGGHIVGSSDAKGEEVKDRPVYPADLIASIYDLLGIDPNAPLPHPQGTLFHAVPSADEGVKMAGRLVEIM